MNSIIPGTIEAGLDTHKVGTLEAPSGGAVNMHTIKSLSGKWSWDNAFSSWGIIAGYDLGTLSD
jgi:hypothetical protein